MKTENRRGAKAPSRQAARLSAKVSAEAYQRLCVHALMSGQTMSDVLDRLILSGCREFSLPGKITARTGDIHRVVHSDPVMDSEAAPPSQVAA